MAKRKSKGGNAVADQIAKFIGKSMGGLANRKDSLQRELADVERQIAGVRDSVMRQFGGAADVTRAARKAVKAARKSARKAISPETRKKMADAAKARWATAKKAGKQRLG